MPAPAPKPLAFGPSLGLLAFTPLLPAVLEGGITMALTRRSGRGVLLLFGEVMGKAIRGRKAVNHDIVRPTPEQIASGAYAEDYVIHDATGLKAMVYRKRGIEQNGRLFRESHFDRLNRAGRWTRDQYLAGNWYRHTYECGRYDAPATSDLLRVHGSVASIEAAYSSRQRARDQFRAARKALPADTLGIIDGLLLHNRWPKMHHRERHRIIARIAQALDKLAEFLRRERV